MMHNIIPHFDVVIALTGFVAGVYVMCIVWALNGGNDE